MEEMMGTRKQRKFKRRQFNRLDVMGLKKKEPGMHCDGNGLYLVVQDNGSRSWVLRTVVRGKRCDLGLGGLCTRSLADAREEAGKLRARARRGEDIITKKRIEQKKTNTPTFED